MENHCLYRETCCRASESDCKEPFNLNHTYHAYTNCSGRHSCSTIQSPWKQMNCGASYKTSTYVSLEYDCEPGKRRAANKMKKNRGSYISAHVLLNLINKLRKSDKMRGSTIHPHVRLCKVILPAPSLVKRLVTTNFHLCWLRYSLLSLFACIFSFVQDRLLWHRQCWREKLIH